MKNRCEKNCRMIRLLSGWMIFLLLPGIVHAQTYTLQDVLDSIARNNPGLQRFGLKTRSGIAMSHASKAWAAPKAGFGLSEFPYGKTDRMNGMAPRKMIMLRVEQMFPNFSKQKAESKYYQSFAAQNNDAREAMKNMLFSKAKSAYYNTLIAEKKEAVLDEQLGQLRLLIKIAEGRLAYRKADLPAIYNARARISDLESKKIQLESRIREGIVRMNTLMDQPPDKPLKTDTSLVEAQNELNILQADSSYVIGHRSDIQLIGHKIKSMRLEQKVIAGTGKPAFGITWDNMRMPGNTYMYNLMAMISIPVAPWSSKGYKSKIKAMDYQIQAMQKRKENRVSEAVGSIRRDWLALQAQRREVGIFRDRVIPAYRKTWRANLHALSENTGDIYKTLMSWNDLTLKRIEYISKLGEMLQLKVKLEAAMQIN